MVLSKVRFVSMTHALASNMKCMSSPAEAHFTDGFTRKRKASPALQIWGSGKWQTSSKCRILNVYTCSHHFLLSDKRILSAWSLCRVPRDLSKLSEGSSFAECIWKTVSLLHWAEDSGLGLTRVQQHEATTNNSTLGGSEREWPRLCVSMCMHRDTSCFTISQKKTPSVDEAHEMRLEALSKAKSDMLS